MVPCNILPEILEVGETLANEASSVVLNAKISVLCSSSIFVNQYTV